MSGPAARPPQRVNALIDTPGGARSKQQPASQKPPVSPCAAFLLAALDEALACASGSAALSDKSVHRFRKALKRARAALRLMRLALGEARYESHNRLLREAARSVVAARDATSLLVAFEGLAPHRASRPDNAQKHVLKSLRAKRLQARRALSRAPSARARSVRRLQRMRDDLGWNAAAADPVALALGLRRVYRKGRKALEQAQRTRSAAALHEWRKQAKYLQNALLALAPARDSRAAGMMKRASELADVLGLEHDLAALSRELQRAAYAPIGGAAIDKLQSRIRKLRAGQQKHALHSGRKLYRPKPKRVLARAGVPVLQAQQLRPPGERRSRAPAGGRSRSRPSGSPGCRPLR